MCLSAAMIGVTAIGRGARVTAAGPGMEKQFKPGFTQANPYSIFPGHPARAAVRVPLQVRDTPG